MFAWITVIRFVQTGVQELPDSVGSLLVRPEPWAVPGRQDKKGLGIEPHVFRLVCCPVPAAVQTTEPA